MSIVHERGASIFSKFSKSQRKLGLLLGVSLVLLVAAVPVAVDFLRLVGYYPWASAESRRQGAVSINDIASRKIDFVIDYYGFRYRGNTGNYIDAHTYYYGAYEKSELYFLRDTLRTLDPHPVVIDVGANTGLYSLFASKYAEQVHAIEPYPPVLASLRSVIAENKIANIVVHPVGLGETEAELPFFSPPEANQGTGSFLSDFLSANTDEHLRLTIVAGDKYFPLSGITRVSFIKIDIEGYEKAALAGLQQTLQRHRPVVLMEVSVDPAVESLFKSMKELQAAFPENYEFFRMADQDPVTGTYRLLPFRPAFDRKTQFNVVARPNEKAGAVPMTSEGHPTRSP